MTCPYCEMTPDGRHEDHCFMLATNRPIGDAPAMLARVAENRRQADIKAYLARIRELEAEVAALLAQLEERQ